MSALEAGLPAVLLTTPAEVDSARTLRAEGRTIVAGTLHVRNLLRDAGVDAVSAADLLDTADRTAILADVAEMADRLRTADWTSVPPELSAMLQSILVRWAFHAFARRRAQASLGEVLKAFADDGRLTRADRPEASKLGAVAARPGRARAEQPPVDRGLRTRHRVFDFRSTSSSKLDAAAPAGHVRPMATGKSDLQVTLKNAVWAVRREQPRKLRYNIPPVLPAREAFPLLDLAGALSAPGSPADADAIRLIDATVLAFRTYRSAMRGMLRRYGRAERVLFNHVSGPEKAGYLAALKEAGIEAEMSSHGCLVRTGARPRDAVAETLGPCLYNNFPGMDRVVPRSPLQARDATAGQDVGKVVRTVASGGPRAPGSCRSGPFRILHAPNFLPWAACYHGLAIDCFQTRDAVAALARTVAASAGFELDVRIKVTAADTPGSIRKVVRGVMPADVADLMDPGRGVRDSSTGSHAEGMARSDLVVTEGLTAVMFEALEMRKPVLLLGAAGLPPALPHLPATALLEGAPRAPVYAATPEDDLPAILNAIARLHADDVLTDAEIDRYVWTHANV